MKTIIISLALFLCACTHSELAGLTGQSPENIRHLKGKPVTILGQNGKEMWTYRNNDCTQILFFDESKKVVDWHEMGQCLPSE